MRTPSFSGVHIYVVESACWNQASAANLPPRPVVNKSRGRATEHQPQTNLLMIQLSLSLRVLPPIPRNCSSPHLSVSTDSRIAALRRVLCTANALQL